MSEHPGGLIPGDGPTCWARGTCPLDGYQLIETEPDDTFQGGWEHVIPAAELKTEATQMAARRRIAEAHAPEAVAEAEQITRRG